MDKKSLQELIDKVHRGDASELELRSYNAYLDQLTGRHSYPDHVSEADEEGLKAELSARLRLTIAERGQNRPKFMTWGRFAAAATVLLVITAALFSVILLSPAKQPLAQNMARDILPGSNRAVLTLANGQQVILSNTSKGQIATQGGVSITKTASGSIVYDPADGRGANIVFNTMTTPKGGQYRVVLSDGSQVLLNAASSLRYPSGFSGNERNVELTGEAYFEIAHDAARPFHVISKGQRVEVLGTHFIVSAYGDEPAVKTTLLQGSVRVDQKGQATLLRPGQQATLSATGISVKEVDTDIVAAWTKGKFIFDDEPLQQIMRKIARWYDVDINYAEGIDKDMQFGGDVSRYEKVSDVLHMLELTQGAHFKIEGRRIVVTK